MNIEDDLQKFANPDRAQHSLRFFKTGKGQYGEGDVFIGLTNPQVRAIAKEYYQEISLDEVEKLLQNKIHEYRLTALIILVYKFEKAEELERKKIYDFYFKNVRFINNWDLVDISVQTIVGGYLLDKPRKILYELVESKNLWERRIAIVSTFAFIRKKQLDDTYQLAKLLLSDKQDLIHKAVGWALREVGKVDEKRLEIFLKANINLLPRTTLRYAIEKFSEIKRKYFLKLI